MTRIEFLIIGRRLPEYISDFVVRSEVNQEPTETHAPTFTEAAAVE